MVFLLRRLAHACIIFATLNSKPIISIICFDVIQVLYLIYLLAVRPFTLISMFMNVLGELSILAYFLYLTIKPSPELQTHYKIIIIMMVVIFIVTYLMSFVDMIYTALWAIYK